MFFIRNREPELGMEALQLWHRPRRDGFNITGSLCKDKIGVRQSLESKLCWTSARSLQRQLRYLCSMLSEEGAPCWDTEWLWTDPDWLRHTPQLSHGASPFGGRWRSWQEPTDEVAARQEGGNASGGAGSNNRDNQTQCRTWPHPF